jgi:hypothetical protein
VVIIEGGDMSRLTVTITYDIVTWPEDYEGPDIESGFYMPGGWHYPCPSAAPDSPEHRAWLEDDYTLDYDSLRDIARDAIRSYFSTEQGCDYLVYGGQSDDTAENEHGETGTESRAMHKGDGITEDEWARVMRWVAARSVPDDCESCTEPAGDDGYRPVHSVDGLRGEE